MNIICLLSVKPSTKTYNFFRSIKENTEYDVYIVIDDNNYTIPDYKDDGVVKIIKIDNKECEQNGFKNSILWLNNRAGSRDKALYYFTKESIPYNHIWFVEEDVFIPSVNTIPNIDKKYKYEHDLLVPSHNIINTKQTDWHWKHINHQIKINPPYAHSMVCAIRCSKAMLNSIKDYAKAHNNLFLDEALFNTLAVHNKLKVLCIQELSTIVFRQDWRYCDIFFTNLYHPIKDIDTQYSYREKGEYEYNKLPAYVNLSSQAGGYVKSRRRRNKKRSYKTRTKKRSIV
jgi:hypothetical protein